MKITLSELKKLVRTVVLETLKDEIKEPDLDINVAAFSERRFEDDNLNPYMYDYEDDDDQHYTVPDKMKDNSVRTI